MSYKVRKPTRVMCFVIVKKGILKYIYTVVLLCLISVSLTAHSSEDDFYEYGYTVKEQETLEWLWQKAQQFSGIESIHYIDFPYHLPIYIMTQSRMHKEICPEDPLYCRNFIGAYDTGGKRILLQRGFTPEEGIISASFLLHEFIHALQHETISDVDLSGSCSGLRSTEKEAYDGQNNFLQSEGVFFRAGVGLRLMICPEDSESHSVSINQSY